MAKANGWTRDQLLIALRLYMRTPFGKLHRLNPEIIALSAKIGRTPSALAMKASNFASIDSKLKRKGLANSSNADVEIWNEFESNPTALALEAEDAATRFEIDQAEIDVPLRLPTGPTEKLSLVRVRLVQSFFRAAVLTSYENRCAISGIAVPELLVASHIIPWSDSVERRADPTNGLCLNALFDRAFDRGFLAIDDSQRVMVSKSIKRPMAEVLFECDLLAVEGQSLRMPTRFAPDPEALRKHRETTFRR
jgi:putative restriction endonuclease